MGRDSWIWMATALALCALGCQQQAGGEGPTPGSPRWTPAPLPSALSPTARDEAAMDEGLRQALGDLRDRFRCNSVSGCPAHGVLVAFGAKARKPLEALFPRAPRQAAWRARIVRILADIGDRRSRPLLRGLLADRSDKVRAYALYGLIRVGDPQDHELIRGYADDDGVVASAMTRATAAWGTVRLGDSGAAARFIELLEAAGQQTAGARALRWGIHLCQQPPRPDCAAIARLAARHPAYLVRREVLRWLQAYPRKAWADVLVVLAADPSSLLARQARGQLISLTGRVDLRTAAQWRAWCEAGGCARPQAPRARGKVKQRGPPRPRDSSKPGKDTTRRQSP